MTQTATKGYILGAGLTVEEYNKAKIELAISQLRKTLVEAIHSGKPGAYGIRVPAQKRDGQLKLGNVRVMMEMES